MGGRQTRASQTAEALAWWLPWIIHPFYPSLWILPVPPSPLQSILLFTWAGRAGVRACCGRPARISPFINRPSYSLMREREKNSPQTHSRTEAPTARFSFQPRPLLPAPTSSYECHRLIVSFLFPHLYINWQLVAAVFTQLKRCFCNESGEEGETKKQGPNSVDLQRNFLPLRHSRSPRRSVSFRSLSFETGIEALKRICMHELITVMGWAWGVILH